LVAEEEKNTYKSFTLQRTPLDRVLSHRHNDYPAALGAGNGTTRRTPLWLIIDALLRVVKKASVRHV